MSELRIEYMALSKIEPAARNPKKHDDAMVEASLTRFGQWSPIVMDDRTNRLVAGHGRLGVYKAMKAAGKPAPARIRVDEAGEWHVPVLRGAESRDDKEAEAYLLADNRTSEIGGWDFEMLSGVMTELSLEGTGFSNAEFKTLQKSAASIPDLSPAEETPRLDQLTSKQVICPHCGQTFTRG
jgi:hypothetical protein